ncbi:MAG TPA: histidine kinase dimerization/phosphoacceptor domain -containing protein [Azospirillaceae bacterium]|nr:histidine kinase dimerization/phosphoacceptor domain -containing protein [Azospirillaceae bacterium]
MRILLVDDNPNDRILARRALARDIPDASFAEAGEPEALDEALRGFEPDVVVTDYSLGWGDGIQVFRRVRDLYPDCGVVMFSGSLGEEAAIDVMRAGLDDFVLKDPARLGRLVTAVTGVMRQVHDRRARRRAEARRAALQGAAGVGLFTARPDGGLLEANGALWRLLGRAPGEAGAVNLRDLCPRLAQHWPPEGLAAPLQGVELTFARPGGTASALLDAIPVPEAGGEVEGVLTDVTALRTLIDQRTTLLREVYHRVYNNLQAIDSLLLLQAQRAAEPGCRAALLQIGERLRALALIQQRLYRGDDFRTLGFDGYLRELAAALAATQGDDRGPRIEVEAEPLCLDVERAIPVGLIATELLTNALKHAFPRGGAGRVLLSLAVRRPAAVLTVEDDGVGAPADLYGGCGEGGIGSAVVPQLLTQIDGRIDVASGEGGTRVTVTFLPADASPA